MPTYEIPERNFPGLKAKIEKLNKRAAKLGVGQIKFEVTGENLFDEWVMLTMDCHVNSHALFPVGKAPGGGLGIRKTGRIFKNFLVLVEGETPKFAGWTFAATIQVSEGGNILRKAPGLEVELAKYRDCKPECEHCKVNRFRRDTFVVLHDSGETKQVGRQCIRDFLGHNSPENLAAAAELVFSLGEICSNAERDDLEDYGNREPERVSLELFLAYVAEMVTRFGFLSRKNAEIQMKQSTTDLALSNMFPPRNQSREKIIRPTPEAETMATQAREFALEVLGAKSELNDFEHNLLSVAKCEAIEFRSCGIAAYLVEYMRRETEAAAKRAKLSAESKHWGEVKKRYKGQKLSFLGSSSFESAYGICWIHRFAAEDGALLVWKTSSPLNYAQGHTFEATFSVKEHSEYKGQKQTLISRVTV